MNDILISAETFPFVLNRILKLYKIWRVADSLNNSLEPNNCDMSVTDDLIVGDIVSPEARNLFAYLDYLENAFNNKIKLLKEKTTNATV